MANDKERLTTAQWVLERQLAWIAAADSKVAAIVALNTALLGGLAAAFGASAPATHTAWAYLFTLSAAGLSVISVFCAAMAMHPRTLGPLDSLLFFGRIAEQSSASYQAAFSTSSDSSLLLDWTAQIHRNAQIASDKFLWVRRGMGWSFFASLPWIAAVALLVKL